MGRRTGIIARSLRFAPGLPWAAISQQAHSQGATRLQHARASQSGKQRRQAAALHIRQGADINRALGFARDIPYNALEYLPRVRRRNGWRPQMPPGRNTRVSNRLFVSELASLPLRARKLRPLRRCALLFCGGLQAGHTTTLSCCTNAGLGERGACSSGLRCRQRSPSARESLRDVGD